MDSQLTPLDWDPIFAKQEEQYTWESKLPQIVWRGSLSDNNDSYQSARWGLCVRVAKLRETEDPKTIADWFNVGLTSIPARHDGLRLNVSEAGGLVKPIPEQDFQKYAGILDVDGNAWSSRFGQLLCYNSVVLKVEPVFVEYFYKDLIAWEHYVPVKADLSDLVEIASFVLDPDNDPVMRQIVVNANQWCRNNMVQAKLANDTLDVLERYVGKLHAGDPAWTETWSRAKAEMFVPTNGYAMIQLCEGRPTQRRQ